MSWYTSTALLHAAIGCSALLSFWVAGLSKKGSAVHKLAGKIYLLSMTGILISGMPMSLYLLFYKNFVSGAFLTYLLFITATSVWMSWRAIQDKQNFQRFIGPVYRLLMVLNFVSAACIIAIALMVPNDSQIILLAFSSIGIIGSIKMFRFMRQAPTETRWWLRQHISAMIGNGVATHIAFLLVGLPKVMPMLSGPMLQNIGWLAPLTVSLIAGVYLKRKYLPNKI
jgi:uncharacterized membrane protein